MLGSSYIPFFNTTTGWGVYQSYTRGFNDYIGLVWDVQGYIWMYAVEERGIQHWGLRVSNSASESSIGT